MLITVSDIQILNQIFSKINSYINLYGTEKLSSISAYCKSYASENILHSYICIYIQYIYFVTLDIFFSL